MCVLPRGVEGARPEEEKSVGDGWMTCLLGLLVELLPLEAVLKVELDEAPEAERHEERSNAQE